MRGNADRGCGQRQPIYSIRTHLLALTPTPMTLRPSAPILTGAIALIAATTSVDAFAQRTPASPHVLPDSLIVEVSTILESRRTLVDQVWPGFWDDRDFGVFPFRDSLMLVVRPGGADLAGASDLLLPGRIRAHVWTAPSVPSPGFDLAHPVAGVPMLVVSPPTDVGVFQDKLTAALFYTLHEGFHEYQFDHSLALREPDWDGFIGGRGARPGDPWVREMLADERELLARAILSTEPGQELEILRVYGERREERWSQMGGDFTEAGENQVEWQEGVATYVGYAAALVASGDDRPLRDVLVAELRDPRSSRIGSDSAYVSHLYATGAVKTFLVLHSDSDARQMIERGATLDSLLFRSASDPDGSEKAETPVAARR